MALYEKIFDLCTKKGVSINRLEVECGFSPATIYKWKKVNPHVWRLKKVADYFGVTIDELLKEEG